MIAAQQPVDVTIDQLPTIAEQHANAIVLVGMLAEDGEHFSGLSVEETDWLRAHIYAAIALTDAPANCLERAHEDLRTSSSPIVLAGIARALREAGVGPDWANDLISAKRRIELSDQFPEFRFDPPATSCCEPRSCVQELDKTIAKIVPDSDGVVPDPTPNGVGEMMEPLGTLPATFFSANLQDQDGADETIAGLTEAKPIVLALFYTRCMNPLKCSLTITRLAKCASTEPRLSYVGMSYDPDYDTSHRLRIYGEDRHFPFDANARLVRSVDQWDEIQKALNLRAGYGTTTVNSHEREVFVVASDRQAWRIPPDWLLYPAKIVSFYERSEAL